MKKHWCTLGCILFILISGCNGHDSVFSDGTFISDPTESTEPSESFVTKEISLFDDHLSNPLSLQQSTDSAVILCGSSRIMADRHNLNISLYLAEENSDVKTCFFQAENCKGELHVMNSTEFALSGFYDEMGLPYALKFSLDQLEKPVHILEYGTPRFWTQYDNGYWYYTSRTENNPDAYTLYRADETQTIGSIAEEVEGMFLILEDRIYFCRKSKIWMCALEGGKAELFLDLSCITLAPITRFTITNDHVVATFDETGPGTVFVDRLDHTVTYFESGSLDAGGYVETEEAYFFPVFGDRGLYRVDKDTLNSYQISDLYTWDLSYVDGWLYFYTPPESYVDGIYDSEEKTWRMRPDGTEQQCIKFS